MTATLDQMLEMAYESLEGSSTMADYSERHGIESAAILTVYDDERAALVAEHLRDRITGKTVIEIGGGIGILAFHLAQIAKRVILFEANPAWSWVFVGALLSRKPKNVTYIFGAAEELAGELHGDIALFCTHSAVGMMRAVGELFAPEVIDVYGEIISAIPDLALEILSEPKP